MLYVCMCLEEVIFGRSTPLDFCRKFSDPLWIFAEISETPWIFHEISLTPLDFPIFLRGTPLDGKSDLLNIGVTDFFWNSPICLVSEKYHLN